MAASTKPSYTLSHQPHTWSLHGKNGMLVYNMDTGETTFGDGYTLDDAVRIFWESVGRKVGPTDELLRRDVAWCEGRDAAAAEFDRTWPEASAFDLIRELKLPYAERAKDVITRARLLLNQMPAESKARGAAWPSSIPRERAC